MSRVSGLETRRLHALAHEEMVERRAVHAEDAADTNSVQPPVVNQATDRLRMDAELLCDVADADESFGLVLRSRHASCNLSQVLPNCSVELRQ